MPKGRGGGGGRGKNLVDDELDSWEYADEYAEEENWKDSRHAAKMRGEEEEPPTPTELAKPKPKPNTVVPKAMSDPPAKPQPKPAPAAPPTPPASFVEPEPVLETVDDWEAAMDALDAYETRKEEIRVKEAAATAAATATQKKAGAK